MAEVITAIFVVVAVDAGVDVAVIHAALTLGDVAVMSAAIGVVAVECGLGY